MDVDRRDPGSRSRGTARDARRGHSGHCAGEATLDLLNAGLIDDPFDGDNENKQQWIGDVDWRFTCRFDWQDDGSDRHDLVAYGLDTIADIALNGRPYACTRNFHRSYRWDVRGSRSETAPTN